MIPGLNNEETYLRNRRIWHPKKEAEARCTSPRCISRRYGKDTYDTDRSTGFAVKKVKKTATTCPDCGYMLWWVMK